jgi:hypothetical protein
LETGPQSKIERAAKLLKNRATKSEVPVKKKGIILNAQGLLNVLPAKKIKLEMLTNSKYLVYQRPSVVTEEEVNFIINPSQADMKMVRIIDVKDYAYDLRLKIN